MRVRSQVIKPSVWLLVPELEVFLRSQRSTTQTLLLARACSAGFTLGICCAAHGACSALVLVVAAGIVGSSVSSLGPLSHEIHGTTAGGDVPFFSYLRRQLGV